MYDKAERLNDLQPAIKVIMVKRDHSRPPSGRVFMAIRMGKDQNSPNKQWLRKAKSQYPVIEQISCALTKDVR
jgi:hypothetical protein